MAKTQRSFFGQIKTVAVKGDLKTDGEGRVIQQPEVHVVFAMPLDIDAIRNMTFLAAVKSRGMCTMTIEASQLSLDFEDDDEGAVSVAAKGMRDMVDNIRERDDGIDSFTFETADESTTIDTIKK